MKHYVYLLIDPRNNQPFYIGKGQKRRVYRHLSEAKLNPVYWNNIEKCKKINEITSIGLEVKIEQIFTETDEQARHLEQQLILQYGRLFNNTGILTNRHIGGGGFGHTGKPICQYDLQGNLIAEYESVATASQITGISPSCISAVCRGEWAAAHQYQWRWKGSKPPSNYRRTSHQSMKVYQYDMEGNFIREYENSMIACEVNDWSITSSKISCVCNLTLPSFKGYQWRYIKYDKIESTLPRNKIVIQYDLDGSIVAEYTSIAEAARLTEINVTSISRCCNNKQRLAGSFGWKFNDQTSIQSYAS